MTDLESLNLPVLEVDARTAKDMRDGKRVSSDCTGTLTVVSEGRLVAIVNGDGTSLKVRRAWS
jgi:tRNA pseudouridine55 synthase